MVPKSVLPSFSLLHRLETDHQLCQYFSAKFPGIRLFRDMTLIYAVLRSLLFHFSHVNSHLFLLFQTRPTKKWLMKVRPRGLCNSFPFHTGPTNNIPFSIGFLVSESPVFCVCDDKCVLVFCPSIMLDQDPNTLHSSLFSEPEECGFNAFFMRNRNTPQDASVAFSSSGTPNWAEREYFSNFETWIGSPLNSFQFLKKGFPTSNKDTGITINVLFRVRWNSKRLFMSVFLCIPDGNP